MNKVILTILTVLLTFTIAFAQTSNERAFQLSFITPLGTNGLNSAITTNKVSINLLGGYSYGNRVAEFGGLYNINFKLTKGVQFAGLLNYTGLSEKAVQFAGIANIALDGTTPLQMSGVSNIAKDVNGVQSAGIINIAKSVNGVQSSGIANIADSIAGLQAAGILNIAKSVDGVQLGLINLADEVDGVSIGLINIVKKNGKQEFEVSFSEALNSAVSFKLGTEKFYTIFSAGVNYLQTDPIYAAGVGFGTHVNWNQGWGNQIEIIGYTLTEDQSFDNDGINMLAQLKLSVSKEFHRHFKIFAGPVFNMTISDYANKATGELGSTLSPWSMWKNDSENTRLNSWIGFTAGIRF